MNESSSSIDPVAEAVGKTVGHAVVTIASEFGKRIIAYWQPSGNEPLPPTVKEGAEPTFPPYAIVGVGRCGSHISAELARMLFANTPAGALAASRAPLEGLLSILRRHSASNLRSPHPMLVIGDIDETTFDDIDKYFQDTQSLLSTLRKLDYRPLAHGGAGHVPAFGEFLTRGLLLLSPYDKSKQCRPWADARQYLIETCVGGNNTPRLVFYVFSSGGGTGSGSAAELVRAQRVAINLSDNPDPELYLTGIAVIPRGLQDAKNRRVLINTGRLLVQYMTEMNIKVDTVENYISAQILQYTYFTTDESGNKRVVLPWDSLGIISNEVMSNLSNTTYEEAEALANRYIAQQIFSMAASQVRTEERNSRDGQKTDSKDQVIPNVISVGAVNFQSTRLDPHDLKTSLRGPYAIAFSTATKRALETSGSIDALFLRSICLPRIATTEDDGVNNMIFGLSVIPEDYSTYNDKVNILMEKLKSERDASSSKVLLTEKDLEPLSQVPLFGRCPRAIFVISAPEKAELSVEVPERLSHLFSWLMPKLNEARYAVVRHPIDYYTLSVFIQSSVVLCPELQKSIRNFIKLCWDCRGQKQDEFNRKFDEILAQDPPIDDSSITQWIGTSEQYDQNIDDFKTLVDELQHRWDNFVEANVSDATRKRELLAHKVQDCFMNSVEVSAAMRFMNYVHRLEIPELA